jgi:hypothetical protein
LEGRARERYDALDRMNTELSWYRGQYDALDALVEALRTADGWLVYRAEALRDQLPELDTQAAEDFSAVERVKRRSWIGTRRCTRRGRIWREHGPWRRSGKPRWPPFGPSSSKIARPSRERVLGRARTKGRPRRRGS